jgi:hypothetical protein
MKKNLFFAVVALAMVTAIGIAACDIETGGGTGGNKDGNLVDGFLEPPISLPPQTWYSLEGINFFSGQHQHQDDRVWGVAAGGGKYVAAGGWLPLDIKAVAHSSNAVDWELSAGDFFSELRCIAYGGGRFVAGDVGDFRQGLINHEDNFIPGNTYYSTDGGRTFTGKVSTGLRNTISLVYGDGKWLALGLDGRMAVSTNGAVSWTEVQQKTINRPPGSPAWLNNSSTILPRGNNSALRSAVFAQGRWIVVGMRGLTAWSTDLETWNVVFIETFTPNTASLQKIIYAQNKLFVVGDVGRMFYSEDLGLTWKPIEDHGFTSDIYDIVYANGFFVAVGSGGRVAYSDSGMVWFPTNNDFGGEQSVNGVAYGGGWWITGARYGVIAVSNVWP